MKKMKKFFNKVLTPKGARNLGTILHCIVMIWIATFTLIAMMSGSLGLLIIAFVMGNSYYKCNKQKIEKIFHAFEKVYG